MLNRRTVITFEKLERCCYQLPHSEPFTSRCDDCGEEVNWLTLAETVAITRLSLRQVFRRVESGAVHFLETPLGMLLICPKSLELEQK